MKRTLAILLALVLGIGALGIGAISAPPLPVDSSSPFEFIIPVVQQTTVPQGYIGIYTAEDLSNIRNNLGGNFILMNDIDLSEINDGEWLPIETFNGILDGQGHVIYNMRVTGKRQGAGLFGFLTGGIIKNLGLVNAYVVVQNNSDFPISKTKIINGTRRLVREKVMQILVAHSVSNVDTNFLFNHIFYRDFNIDDENEKKAEKKIITNNVPLITDEDILNLHSDASIR